VKLTPEAPASLENFGLLIVLWLAWRMRRRSAPGIAVAVFLSAAIYTVALVGFSPELRKQTFLPGSGHSFLEAGMGCRF
jgi:hypothetical protein